MISRTPSMIVFVITISALTILHADNFTLNAKIIVITNGILLTAIQIWKRNYMMLGIISIPMIVVGIKYTQQKNIQFEKHKSFEFIAWLKVNELIDNNKIKLRSVYNCRIIKTACTKNYLNDSINIFIFDKKKFVKRNSILKVVAIYHDNKICFVKKIIDNNNNKITIGYLRNKTRMTKEVKAITMALLFGDKTLLSKKQKELFQNSGTMHLFAVSGLHVGCLFLFLTTLFRSMGLNITKTNFITILLLLIYLYLVNFSVSATRAYTMLLIWVLSRFIGIKTNPINILTITAIIIMINNNSIVTEISYYLTISVVACILYLNQSIKINLKSVFLQKMFNLGLVNVGAFIGSFIIIAKSFMIIVPASLISNMLLVPIIGLLIPFAFVVLAISWIPHECFFTSTYNEVILLIQQLCKYIGSFKYSTITVVDNSSFYFEKYLLFIIIIYNTFDFIKKLKIKILFLILCLVLIY